MYHVCSRLKTYIYRIYFIHHSYTLILYLYFKKLTHISIIIIFMYSHKSYTLKIPKQETATCKKKKVYFHNKYNNLDKIQFLCVFINKC